VIRPLPPDGRDVEPTDLAETLLPLALSQPGVALTRARGVLAGRSTPYDASVAHQVAGIVHRDLGEHALALRELHLARREAGRSGAHSARRTADVLATLGLVLGFAGRSRAALRAFDEARRLTDAEGMPGLLVRRGYLLHYLGRYDDALADLSGAVAGSRRGRDRLWEARGLLNRSGTHLARGQHEAATRDATEAESLYLELGDSLGATFAVHNRAHAARQAGDLPRALALLDEVAVRYRGLGEDPSELGQDRAETLLAAGLAHEAIAVADHLLLSPTLVPLVRAETLLVAARGYRQAGQPALARSRAIVAARLFAAQQRPTWAQRARLLRLQAEYDDLAAHDEPERAAWSRLARGARDVAEAIARAGLPDAAVALLLHGRAASRAGHREEARASLTAAAATRRSGPPLTRAAGWLARALLADEEGDRRTLRQACRRGLDAVDEHRSVMGDLELRALAGDHGLELARLAVRDAARTGSPRDLLQWTERWRATALSSGAALPDDPALGAEVAALRDVTRRITSADDPEPSLTRERARLEAAVRRRQRHLRSTGAVAPADAAAALGALGDTTLLYLVHVDDELQLLTARGGRVRRRVVGPMARALDETSYATFALRRAAYGRPLDLGGAGRRAQAALLGELSPVDGPVLVVPPAALLSAPWSLLPALTGAVLTVAPSLSAWHRAHETPSPDGPVVLVTGPGLTTEQQEASIVGGRHPGVVTLGDAEATVGRTLAALDGARLGHIAAHGHLRTDAPLFSAIDLADGPLMVHDLQRLVRSPGAVVLSACESAGMISVTSDEALGLVSALLGMGTRSVVASVAAVNDRATVSVMAHVHTSAASGGSLAEGLRAARSDEGATAVVRATAAAFTAFGA